MTINIEEILNELKNVSDEDLRNELSSLKLKIDDQKYQMAFSLYGFTKYLSALDLSGIKNEFPVAEMARFRSVVINRAYVTLVYMRSHTLEKSLDNLKSESPIIAFKKYFRSGRISSNQDTLAQRMRNSICHGDFKMDLEKITFCDNGWSEEIELSQFFDEFCPQIFRFYLRAYEANKGDSTSKCDT